MTDQDCQPEHAGDTAPTFFCPRCDYSLTGLRENRCPECGGEFDPDLLEELVECRPRPISPWQLSARLLPLPVGLWLLMAATSTDRLTTEMLPLALPMPAMEDGILTTRSVLAEMTIVWLALLLTGRMSSSV